MSWGGPRGSRAARARSVVLVWFAVLVLGSYALLLTALVAWGR